MGKSNFLDNLKKAVDDGEFNSDAAKKINEITELADKKNNAGKIVNDRVKSAGIKKVTEEEAIEINSNYEKKMYELKRLDEFNKSVSDFLSVEYTISKGIEDMLENIKSFEDKFGDFFSDEKYNDVILKIKQIKTKYESIINQ